jgi:hypothetical protein
LQKFSGVEQVAGKCRKHLFNRNYSFPPHSAAGLSTRLPHTNLLLPNYAYCMAWVAQAPFMWGIGPSLMVTIKAAPNRTTNTEHSRNSLRKALALLRAFRALLYLPIVPAPIALSDCAQPTPTALKMLRIVLPKALPVVSWHPLLAA